MSGTASVCLGMSSVCSCLSICQSARGLTVKHASIESKVCDAAGVEKVAFESWKVFSDLGEQGDHRVTRPARMGQPARSLTRLTELTKICQEILLLQTFQELFQSLFSFRWEREGSMKGDEGSVQGVCRWKEVKVGRR
jgi:hypothetical protein